jgi:hypothetical protein
LGDPASRLLDLECVVEPLRVETTPAPASSGARVKLPVELAAPLRAAAGVADFAELRALIDSLGAEHAATRAELGRLADDFAYERIDALLR